MSSLIGKFMRDVDYLKQGLQPKKESGESVTKLSYEGEKHEQLKDEDIAQLAAALMTNDVFQGQIDLSENDFSDKGALELSRLFEKRNVSNISALKLNKNKLGSKTGEYIGDAISRNPEYKINKLSFGKICLEDIGLVRIMEACNLNKNIQKLNIGVLTNCGLMKMAELLKENDSLEELKFTETKDHQKYWTEEGRAAFLETLKKCTQLKKIKVKFEHDETDDDKLFEKEIKFYTKQKSEVRSKGKDYEKRLESCDPTHMFENMMKLVEDKERHHKMPVRKFFNNTFATMLSQAFFLLKKKQSKYPNHREYFTCEGQIKFVAFHLLDNLPDGEVQAEGADLSGNDSDQ